MITHVDATGYWIAVSLVDDEGRDPDWVNMVMFEKGHGHIDIDAARQWLRDNPKAMCRCDRCVLAMPVAAAKREMQLSLF